MSEAIFLTLLSLLNNSTESDKSTKISSFSEGNASKEISLKRDKFSQTKKIQRQKVIQKKNFSRLQ